MSVVVVVILLVAFACCHLASDKCSSQAVSEPLCCSVHIVSSYRFFCCRQNGRTAQCFALENLSKITPNDKYTTPLMSSLSGKFNQNDIVCKPRTPCLLFNSSRITCGCCFLIQAVDCDGYLLRLLSLQFADNWLTEFRPSLSS